MDTLIIIMVLWLGVSVVVGLLIGASLGRLNDIDESGTI